MKFIDNGAISMNIDSYRMFLRTARLGSLSAAAEQSGYTQGAVSHIIASLEKEFRSSRAARAV